MNHERLIQLIDAYGSRPDNWPEEERESALGLIGSDTVAQDHALEMAALDRALDGYTMVDHSLPRARILGSLPRRIWIDRLIDWLLPEVSQLREHFWRPALAACLPLVIGVLVGTNLVSTETDYSWDDEISMVALDETSFPDSLTDLGLTDE